MVRWAVALPVADLQLWSCAVFTEFSFLAEHEVHEGLEELPSPTTHLPNTSGSWTHFKGPLWETFLSALEQQEFNTFSRTTLQVQREKMWESASSSLKYHPKPFPGHIPCSPRRESRGEVSIFDHTAPFLSPLWGAAANTAPTMAAFKLFPGATGKQGKH